MMSRLFGNMVRRSRTLVGLAVAHALFYPYKWRWQGTRNCPRRLHVGCGANRFPGWLNADISPTADIVVFMERSLPFKQDFLERIYSEHVLEHVPYETGVFFLSEAHRTLMPGGCIRIAVPDLEDIVDSYHTGDWKRLDWVNWPEYSFIKTRAEMINIAFRWWGHRHLYDREELKRALAEAGFSQIRFVDRGESDVEDLRGLETREDSTLIAEAVKT